MNGNFDLIVDKGTLDAVLVEGSVFQMLEIVYNLLNVGGVYLICSLHEKEMISSLLGIEELGFKISTFETGLLENKRTQEEEKYRLEMLNKLGYSGKLFKYLTL